MPDESHCCDFCFNSNVPLYESGVDKPTRICGFCAAQAVAQTTPPPEPAPEPTPLPERPSKEARVAYIPMPKTGVAHLDQYVVGQEVAKRRLALGVTNHYKRIVDVWDRYAADPIVTEPDLRNVRIEKSVTTWRPCCSSCSRRPAAIHRDLCRAEIG
jgi:ATP-dependent protease Clp ATPase subunit